MSAERAEAPASSALVTGIGERIRIVRSTAKLSAEAFGARIGVHRNSVVRYESEQVYPDVTIAAKICAEFKVSEAWLIRGIAPSGDFFLTPGGQPIPVDTPHSRIYSTLLATSDYAFHGKTHSLLAVRQDYSAMLSGQPPDAPLGLVMVTDDSMAPTLLPGDRVLFCRSKDKEFIDGIYILNKDVRPIQRIRRIRLLGPNNYQVTCDNSRFSGASETRKTIHENARRVIGLFRETPLCQMSILQLSAKAPFSPEGALGEDS